MSKDDETPDCEVGYGKPPKSGQFKKGVSGNPSGRPKKPTDFYSVVMREADLKVTVKENGKPRKLTMRDLFVKRIFKNAVVTGSVQTQRLLSGLLEQAQQRMADIQQNSAKFPDYPSANPEDLTDEQLAYAILKGTEMLEEESRKRAREAAEGDADPPREEPQLPKESRGRKNEE